MFRFHKKNVEASTGASERRVFILALICLVLTSLFVLRQGRFHVEVRALVLEIVSELVLAWLVKTGLHREQQQTFYLTPLFIRQSNTFFQFKFQFCKSVS